MTIKTRLSLLVMVAFIGLLLMFIGAKHALNNTQQYFEVVVSESLPNMIEVEEFIARSIQLQRDAREILLTQDPDIRKILEARMSNDRALHKKSFEYFHEHFHTDTGKALLNDVQTLREQVSKSHKAAEKMAKEGNEVGAGHFLTSAEVMKQGQQYREASQKMVAYQKELVQKSIDAAENAKASMETMLLGVFLMTLIVLLSIIYIAIRQINLSITSIVESVSNAVKNMSFSERLAKRSDELNPIASSVNVLFHNLEQGFDDISHVTLSLANGALSERITNHYVGDLNKLKNNINTSIEKTSETMHTLGQVIQCLSVGQFNLNIDTQAPGEYGNMLNNVSRAIQELNKIIYDINHVMHKMNDGDFSHRVKADALGDLLSLKTNINQSMTQIEMAMRSITTTVHHQSKGDLTHECKATFAGQLEETKNALNDTNAHLKTVVSQAVEASNIVNEAASQVSQGSADLSMRVQEQAAALEQTSATMNEMTSAVQANTANARKVAELTNQVQDQAIDGVQVMQQTITAMQSIKASSSKINDIVSIIDSIAFQTNLLALNAAVEAARAGEHGRGFAVVASEVRALAGKSADAAKDIKTLITDSVTRIENGTQLADKSGEMLNGIAGSIQHIATMIEEIADASNEQSVGISQVHLAIANIDRVTQENAALVEETTNAAESLSTEANNLRDSMSFFKTGQTNSLQAMRRPTHQKQTATTAMALPAPKKTNSEEWGEF